ncbi:MAG: hypothetical protein AABY53_07780 [Bdellovibrionota bacterium]
MLTHLEINEENRNQDWDEKFFKLFSESSLQILADDPQQGPDGWPYLICDIILEKTSDTRPQNDKIDSAQKILHWLSTRGIGLVVNPKKLPYPDYVFSYGMIWSFRETGYFIKYQNLDVDKKSDKKPDKKFVINQNSNLKVGPPSPEYFPQYVRSIIKDFLRDQSVFDARILMISTDGKNYDLCFSLESLGSPPEVEHEGILEAISWFLPPHYSVAVVSEKGLQGFESL